MDFWSTVLGHQLAETLVRTLPMLARSNKEIKQYPVTCGATNEAVLSVFQEEQEKGSRFIQAIPTANNQLVMFFEADE